MSLINKKIKPFKNMAFRKSKFFEITERDIHDKWCIFFFYPADFTFVCPTELSDLADHYEAFKKLNVEILSVSTDTHFSHKAWFDSSGSIRKIKYTMVSDHSKILTTNFNLLSPVGLSERGTVIVNPSGVIKYLEVISDEIGRNISELVRKVQAIQYVHNNPNYVCPTKWKSGDKPMRPSIELVGKI